MRENLSLFMRLFHGRDDVYGTYNPKTGKAWQVKNAPGERVYLNHLTGKSPLAIYPLIENSKIHFAVIDFDEPDGNLPKDAVRCARHHGFSPVVEISRGKGFHVWFFFDEKVEAWKARALLKTILSEISYPKAEVFPKQDRIKNGYGNCINLPLFGQHLTRGKTVFINGHFYPIEDQWRFLKKIKLHTSQNLDDWLEANNITHQTNHSQKTPLYRKPNKTFGLLPCFQTMLCEGVQTNQRIACFWLAVQLRKVGLPFESALLILQDWSRKNRPAHGKEIISGEEVYDQTLSAFQENPYRGCGCDDEPMHSLCDKNCPIFHCR